MFKRGLSPVVATVLVILITVVAAMLVAGFVIPWIRDQQEGTKECFDVLGDLEFYNSEYNCYTPNGNNPDNTGFSVKFNNEDIVGFVVSAISKGRSDTFEVINQSSFLNLKNLGDSSFGGVLDIPTNGGVRTYVFNGKADDIEISPILSNGESCERSGSMIPILCSDEVRKCITNGGDDC